MNTVVSAVFTDIVAHIKVTAMNTIKRFWLLFSVTEQNANLCSTGVSELSPSCGLFASGYTSHWLCFKAVI